MPKRLVYPHWLSSEYSETITWGRSDHRETLALAAGRFLKLYALFGVNLALSDMQTIEGPALLFAFESRDFARFLGTNPDFLTLVGRPAKGWNRTADSVCAFGLERCLAPAWITGYRAESAGAVVALADVLLNEAGKQGTFDMASMEASRAVTNVLQRYPSDSDHLKRILTVLAHFTGQGASSVVTPPPETSGSTLYTVLDEVRRSPDARGDAARYYEETLQFVEDDGNVEEPDRGRQAIIFQALERAAVERRIAKHSRLYRTIRNTTHHAWESAVQRTVVGKDGLGSFGYLPDSAPVSECLPDHIRTSVLVPFGGKHPEDEFVQPRFPTTESYAIHWDPTELSWADIVTAVDATADKRAEFQAALEARSPEKTRDALEDLISALSAHFADRTTLRKDGWLWNIATAVRDVGQLVGSVTLIFGFQDVAPVAGVATGAGLLGQKALGGLRSGQRYAIGNAMRRAADALDAGGTSSADRRRR